MPLILMELGVAVALVAILWIAAEVGFQVGKLQTARKSRRRQAAGESGDIAASQAASSAAQLGTIQGAIFGLVALLLGFSFSGATGRFIERQSLLVAEANAIGTAYLRADLLPEPHATAYRRDLAAYATGRMELFLNRDIEDSARSLQDLGKVQMDLWRHAVAGVGERPTAGPLVIPAVNEVIDRLAQHGDARTRHIPAVVLLLLIASTAMALGTVSFGQGLSGKRHTGLILMLGLPLAVAMWVTIDMDFPQVGTIQMNGTVLVETVRFISADEAARAKQ